MSWSTTLSTGAGFWDPVIWVIAALVTICIAWLIWRTGERTCERGADAEGPFISGNADPGPSAVHVPGGNLYWGFSTALSGMYHRLIPLHTGLLSDYLLWFLGVTAVILVIVVGVGA
ncbi:MAG: hydrogenase [Methanomicrobiales archaeon]